MLDMPDFMKNSEWYQFDYDNFQWTLTEKAPEEMKKSLEDYNNALKSIDK